MSWQYYFARKFSVQRFEAVVRAVFSDYYQEHFGVSLKSVMILPEEGNQAMYMDPNEWPAAQRKIFECVCADLPTFDGYMKEIAVEQERFITASTECAAGVLPELSSQDLAERYRRFSLAHFEFFIKPIWVPFPVEPLLSEATNKLLVEHLTQTGRVNEYNDAFSLIFSPDEKNAITQAREAILEGVLAGSFDIEAHAKKWEFIPCYDFADEPWGVEYFKKEYEEALRDREGSRNELNELCKGFQRRKKEFPVLLETFTNPRLRDLVVMAKKMAFVKDQRDDYRRLGTHIIRPLYEEIARRAGITLQECVNMLTEEILSFFTEGKLIPRTKLSERVQGYVLLRKGGEVLIFSGANAKKVLQRELGYQKEELQGSAKGIVGSRGSASGPVVIVKTKHDLSRVTDGVIMVAVTTHPDFVPAMRRCAAIVTDEGGITSHAAIVARELGIPCVVGAGRATQVFHEGERIRVDAETGIVQKV